MAKPRRLRLIISLLLATLFIVGCYYLLQEMRSSRWQAHYLADYAKHLTFSANPGTSARIRFPQHGPYDQRLGYTALPKFISRLQDNGYHISSQAEISPQMAETIDYGLYAIYHEKISAGLKIVGGQGQTIFNATFPEVIYANFDSIPPLVRDTLLFIENRKLLDPAQPNLNPAVEWERLGKASFDMLRKLFGADINAAGGSTLATQLEKFRHSPNGITNSATEKFRQMASASLPAYLYGPDTLATRRRIVLDYLNSVPLSAANGHGEVQGIAEGLKIWYGADFAAVNALLETANGVDAASAEQGKAYRQILCLLLAQRRPSYYLGSGHERLQQLADSHLRIMANAGVISPALRDAALLANIEFNPKSAATPRPFGEHKTQTTLRSRLAETLGVPGLYELDRLDLSVASSLNLATQEAAAAALAKLSDGKAARAAGLFGDRLLGGHEDLSKITYSLTLYEHTPQGNLLRIQTDNYQQPLDINEGIRLDLGSTAKLRTTVLYLQLVEDIYRRYARQDRAALKKLQLHERDHLSRWVVDRLLQNPQTSLPEILTAALDKSYSASPGESFFTGGGLHSFANFNKEDNGKVLSVRAALRDSVNLVFIRLIRDIAYHYLYKPDGIYARFEQGGEALRKRYIEQFADQEAKTFLQRFYKKYRRTPADQLLPLLSEKNQGNATRLTVIYRSVFPERDALALQQYLKSFPVGAKLNSAQIAELYDKYGPESFNLHERGYIANIHPLELWLVGYLSAHPGASLKDVYAAGAKERLEAYAWLFNTRHKSAMDIRIQTQLEREAFGQIRDAWRRLGYPFADFTASYASAIGASADQPSALARLLGILLNDGKDYAPVKFTRLHFAAATPYETVLEAPTSVASPLLSPEVAAAAREAAIGVVAQGTAARLKDVYRDADGKPLVVGGKTGTGDHVRKMFDRHGHEIGGEVISRTATFAFFLGPRHFGVITAYVTGPEASRYHFTSALPVQVLKSLRPVLEPLLHVDPQDDPQKS